MRRFWQTAVTSAVLATLMLQAGCSDTVTEPVGITPAATPVTPIDTTLPAPTPGVLTGEAAEAVLVKAAQGATGARRGALLRRITAMQNARTNGGRPAMAGAQLADAENENGGFGSEYDANGTLLQAVIYETNTMIGLSGSLAYEAPSYVSPSIRYSGSRANMQTKWRIVNYKTGEEVGSNEFSHEGVGDVECLALLQGCRRTIYTMTPVFPIGNTPECEVKMTANSKYLAWVTFPIISIPIWGGFSIPPFKWGYAAAGDIADADPGIKCPKELVENPEQDPYEPPEDVEQSVLCVDYMQGWYYPKTDYYQIDNEWTECYIGHWKRSSNKSTMMSFAPAAEHPAFVPAGVSSVSAADHALLVGGGPLPGGAHAEIRRTASADPRTVIVIDTTTSTVDDLAAAMGGVSALLAAPASDTQDVRVHVRSSTIGASLSPDARGDLERTLEAVRSAPPLTFPGLAEGRALDITIPASLQMQRVHK